MLIPILLFTFLGSGISLAIASLLLFKKELIEGKTHFMVAFAAGAMLSVAFLDLLPEAVETLGQIGQISQIGGTILAGMVVFFFLERSLLWYHHHACLPAGRVVPEGEDCRGTKPAASLIIIGDALHNFLDGVTIAGAFLISWPLGAITSLAVFFHEIPHEIGNFGALLALGLQRQRVLFFNLLSATVAFLGAIFAFYFFNFFANFIPYLIAFAAGNFIYIAASDLLPELHEHFEKKHALSETLSFLLGIGVILLTIKVFG